VTYVRNITDVDDKINARALRDFPDLPLNEAIRRVTEKTANQFHADVAALGCLPPTHEPRATDNIPGMIELIRMLIAKGHAYEAAGEVLFDVASMKDYGRLSHRKLEEQQAGARVAVEAHKKNPADFVLWKLSSAEEPGWDSPWGRGRPGWHIECSEMSRRYLGKVFDIHGGGLDLIFPHHENEIAQSRCAFGTEVMANYWMHNGFLQVEGQKMSKSEGNFFTIDDVLVRDATPGVIVRLLMLENHYRDPIDWTQSKVQAAKSRISRWYNQIRDTLSEELANETNEGFWQQQITPTKALVGFLENDLNTPEALTWVDQEYSSETLRSEKGATRLLTDLRFLGLADKNSLVFGIPVAGDWAVEDSLEVTKLAINFQVATANNSPTMASTIASDLSNKGYIVERDGYVVIQIGPRPDRKPNEETIEGLVTKRDAARAAKNWRESDRIRDELAAMGVQIKDNKDGTKSWEIKR
jgi:cysteinyl-tRNA synthetase